MDYLETDKANVVNVDKLETKLCIIYPTHSSSVKLVFQMLQLKMSRVFSIRSVLSDFISDHVKC